MKSFYCLFTRRSLSEGGYTRRGPGFSSCTFSLLLCFLLNASHLAALDYYWVHGSGAWSDFANHWAKIPNPLVMADFHANVPTASDDVYFTGNGSPLNAYIPGTAYTVNVDAGSTVPKCRNMDWTGVPAGTVWGGGGGRMDIYGSLTMDANMSMTFNSEIHFISNDAATKQIWSKTVHFSANVYFEGSSGGWQLSDDFYCAGLVNHSGGLLETNGHTVTIVYEFFGNYNVGNTGQLHLGSSEFIMLARSAYFRYSAAQFDAGTSHIKLFAENANLQGADGFTSDIHFHDVSFFAVNGFWWANVDGTLTFHEVGVIISSSYGAVPVLNNVVFLSDGALLNASNFNHLTLTAGKTYTVVNYSGVTGTDQTILPGGTLTALGAGTCSQFITIKSWQYGTHFNFVNNSGATQTVHCAILEDCHATGSDPLEVIDGVNLGNNTGWIFTAPNPGLDLYWVGGAGDWNDPCHWTSNPLSLVGDCTCLPNGASNVHFTALSGFSLGDVVNVPIDAYCADMDWTGVTGEPKLKFNFNVQLNIYGSMTLAPPASMSLEYDSDVSFGSKIRFRGSGTHTVTTAGQTLDHYTIFEGAGLYRFGDAFNSIGSIAHLNGQLMTMGFPVNIYWWVGNFFGADYLPNPNTEVWLGDPVGGTSSTVTLSNIGYPSNGVQFNNEYSAGKFHAMNSHLVLQAGPGNRVLTRHSPALHDYWKITMAAGTHERGNVLDKLTFTSRGNIDTEGDIHEVDFYENAQIRGNHKFDIISIRGGYFYEFFSGNTQTVNAGGTINVLNANCERLAYLFNDEPNKTAKIAKIGGSLNLNYVVLDNVLPDLTTGATYSATNSVGIQPQVETDWNMTNPAPRNLYWVGGSGTWHDSNHWSLASGDAGGECPPTPEDNVRFDAASGLGAGSVVDVTQVWAFCKDMDWTGVTGGAKFYTIDPGYTPNQMAVFGSLTFSSGMELDFAGSFWMRANGPATIKSAGQHFKNSLYFWEPAGDWTLGDPLLVDYDIIHWYGKLRSNNQAITLGRVWENTAYQPSAELFLGNSTVTFKADVGEGLAWLIYQQGTFHSETSSLIFENNHQGRIYALDNIIELNNVTFKAPNAGFRGSIKSKLIFEQNGYIEYGGTDDFIHEVEFLGDADLTSSRKYHSMKFAPGHRYTFTANTTQTIVPYNGIEGQFIAQGLPGQYIEMKSSNPSVPATIHMDDYNGTSTCTKYLFLTGMTHTGTEDIYVPTPGGNVFNNAGWQFFPCNPCPASIPVLDATASRTATCVPGTAVLVLAGLKPDEWAIWYTDPAATTNIVYNGGTTGPAGNRFEPSITGPVTYYARVYSDGGLCESTVILSVDITIVSPPAAFNVTGGGTVCVDGGGAPIGLDDSETGVEYQLKINGVATGSPVAGTGSALAFGNQTADGTYTVTARLLGTNCMVDMSGSAIVVGSQASAPAVEPSSNGPFCQGAIDFDLILYPGTGQDVIGWQWSGPNGFTSTDQQPIIHGPTPANSGIYTLIVTGLNGCTNEATTEYVEIYPQPETRDDCDLALCEETPGSGQATFDLTEREPCLTLEAGGVEVTYYTDAGLNNEIQMPTEFISGSTTVYALITKASNGCTNTAPMQLTVNPLPTVSIAASPGTTICAPATITLDAGQGFTTYLWSPDGQTDPAIMPTTTGTYTVEVSTAAGCTGTASRMVTVHNPAPVTCPMNQTLSLVAPAFALTGATPTGGTYTGTGVSGGTFTPMTAGLGSHTITYAYTDGNGCPGSCTFTITVQSANPPTIICPPNIVRNTDPNLCSAIVTYPLPSFTAEVAPAVLTLVSGPATASGSAFAKNTTIVNWKVTDGLNRMAVCDFTITVKDNQLPKITCPANLVRNTTAGLCNAVVTYPNPTVSDNCPGVTWMLTAGPASGATFLLGATPVTFEATDAATPVPNKKSCTFTVTVNDNQTPAITCPTNQTKSTAPNACTVAVTYAVTFTDNCTGGMVAIQSGIPSGQPFPKGITTVIWKATDAAGLTKTCSFRVTVNDTQAPAITCPQSVVKNATPNLCSATATYTTPTFTDNCAGGSVVKISGLASGAAFPVGTNVVVWRVTDAAGLVKTCSFTITVNDVQSPTVACPPNVVRNTDPNFCTAVVVYPNPVSTDNCPGAEVWLSTDLASGSEFPLGTSLVIWTAVDDAGLSGTCSFTVTVHDAQAPTLTCPGHITVQGSGTPCGYASANLLSATAEPDNCSLLTVTSDAPTTLPVGATPITWTATDVDGNVSQCVYTVTVECTTNSPSRTPRRAEATASRSAVPSPPLRGGREGLLLQIAPNPATAEVTIWVGLFGPNKNAPLGNDELTNDELTVFDPLGRMVWQKQLDATEQQVTMDVSGLQFSQGMYQVRLRTAGGTVTKGLVVMKL